MQRFILEKSKIPDHYICMDQVNLITCVFRKHLFNETQKFEVLQEPTSEFINILPTLLREMGDWLRENHYDIVFAQ